MHCSLLCHKSFLKRVAEKTRGSGRTPFWIFEYCIPGTVHSSSKKIKEDDAASSESLTHIIDEVMSLSFLGFSV